MTKFQEAVLVAIAVTLVGILTRLIAHDLRQQQEPQKVTLATGLDAKNDTVRCELDSNQVLRIVGQTAVLFQPAGE